MGERTAGMRGTLRLCNYRVNQGFTEWIWTETGAMPVGVRAGPVARKCPGRPVRRPGAFAWNLAEACGDRDGVAGVSRASRDIGRERESKCNDSREDETTERHEWVLPTPPANLSLGPSRGLSAPDAWK